MEVSNEYLIKSKDLTQRFKLKGKVDNQDFTEDDVISGTFKIVNQCSGNEEVNIGSVYIGELNATFRTSINLDSWDKKKIEVSEGMKLNNGLYEYVPLGVFTISEANQTEAGVDVVAYDNMAKFDKKFDVSTTTGTPYQMLQLACSKCGVLLGMTEAQVNALVNGAETLVLLTENDIETYRDFLYWIAQTLCAFATIDRYGKLVLRSYGNSVVDSIDDSHRFTGCRFSKFETRYSGMSVVDIDKNETKYYSINPDEFLTYNLGSNPFLQSGTEAGKDIIRLNILRGLQNIKYVPFKAAVLCGARYELGDVIEFKDGIADATKQSCIMSYTYSFNNGWELEGFGKDPALANAKSKTDKDITGLLSQISDSEIKFYTFTNAHPYIISDGEEVNVVDFSFVSLKKDYVVFQAQILCDCETTLIDDAHNDAEALVTYIINEVEILDFHPKETWVDGQHILTLQYLLHVENNVLNHFVVKLNMKGGNVSINEYNVRASLYGQGIAASDSWNGIINLEEHVIEVVTFDTSADQFNEQLSIEFYTSSESLFEEQAGEISIDETAVDDIREYILKYIYYPVLVQASQFEYDSVNVALQDERLVIIGESPQEVIATLFENVENLGTVSNITSDTNDCLFKFSNDGVTWKSYLVDSWVENTAGMTASQIESLKSNQWMELTDGSLYLKIIMNSADSYVAYFGCEYGGNI